MARNFGDFSLGLDSRSGHAVAGAAEYSKGMNLDRPANLDKVVVNRAQAENIARTYQAAPARDKAAIPSYKALAEETKRQFDFMTRPEHRGGMGMQFEVHKSDPYSVKSPTGRDIPDPAGMMHDVEHNRRIKVLSTATTGSHPFLTDEENDMFRGIHDVFGHAATGRGFDAHGEEAAYRSHRAMFSPLARGAMTTETRGQNSVNNYGGLPKGEYAEQKLVVLPKADLITPFGPGRRASFTTAVAEAKRYHEKRFGPTNG